MAGAIGAGSIVIAALAVQAQADPPGKVLDKDTQGKAAPLWAEKQQKWNQAYTEMNTRLSSGYTSSNNAAQAFQDGDNRSAQIMA